MSDPSVLIIVGAVQTVALAVVAAAVKIWGDKNHAATQASIEVVRQDVNGKMEKMQEVIKNAALAEGKLAGKAEGREEEKRNPTP